MARSYTIHWDQLDRLTEAERMAELVRIGEDVQAVVTAARQRIALRAVQRHGGGHGSLRAAAPELEIDESRLGKIIKRAKENPTMVTIIPCNRPAELYHRYPGQTEPQPCHIELDTRDGRMWADYDGEVGPPRAQPAEVVHGLVRRYPIPAVTSKAANAAMDDIAKLAARIVADSAVEWDGSNRVGRLGDDAQAAEEEIRVRLGCDAEPGDSPWDEGDLVSVWDTDGAILGGGHEEAEYGITAETTDERLEEIAEEIRKDLAEVSPSDEVVLDASVLAYLTERRDEAREGQDDE